MQVLICQPLGDYWLECICRLVTLEIFVVLEVARSDFADIVVNILARLLTTDAKGVAKVAGSQSSFPQGESFNKPIA